MNFMKNLRSVAVASTIATALAFSLPLQASAIQVGVTDSLNTSIMSGHYSSQDNYNNSSNGSENGVAWATKAANGSEGSSTGNIVVDPANSNTSINGSYNAGSGSMGTTNGTFNNSDIGSTTISGGVESTGSNELIVGAFATP